MLIKDFHNLLCVVECPKCGQYPENMKILQLADDYFIASCDNCNTKIRVTYKTEIID